MRLHLSLAFILFSSNLVLAHHAHLTELQLQRVILFFIQLSRKNPI
jgi:hypothetical protein